MDLDHLSLRLRRRGDWEAVDLGFALGRLCWRPVYGAWLTVLLPLLTLLLLTLGGWGLLVFWWLLPLGEVLVLFAVSRAVFAAAPTLKEVLRAAPGLWRHALPELGLRRIHPSRSLRLPVGQLEGFRGAARQERIQLLSSVGQGAPGLLALLVFPSFLLGGVTAVSTLAMWMIPSGMGFDLELFLERFFSGAASPGAYLSAFFLFAAVVLFLQPLQVSAGFAVYLNRRTLLEGWDLEIAFRRLAARLDAGIAGKLAALLVGGLLCLGGASSPAAATEPAAQESRVEWSGDPERDPRQVVTRVMERPELGGEAVEVRWRLRGDLFDGEKKQPETEMDLGFLAVIGGLVGVLAEPLLWLLLALGVLFLLRFLWLHLPEERSSRREDVRPPERLFGLDLRPESLPADVAGTAARLWREGQVAAALSLLYRGALARLGGEGLKLAESFTEDDCLRAAGQALAGARVDFLGELTRTWQRAAYAHRLPADEAGPRLCAGWREHFDADRPGNQSTGATA